jgi:Rha family phage regulatory protein
LDVATYFDKQHKNVLQSIKQVDCSEEFGRLNFQLSSYLNQQGKQQPMYHITKDGFIFLTMSFTGQKAAQIKEAYIRAFNQMEAQLIARQKREIRIIRFWCSMIRLIINHNYWLSVAWSWLILGRGEVFFRPSRRRCFG